MAEATVRFDLGAETVTVALPVDLPTSTPLSGDVSGTFGDCFVAGDLNLTGNLFIEGLMTGIDTFHVQGNGFTIFFQNGGRADLHGKVKAPWGPWGTDSTGWVMGDRLAIAPTKAAVFVPSELVWSDWSMARPVNSPDVILVDGTIAKPEVANLSQTIVFENLARGFHFHDSAGVQMMSDVKFLNCGTTGVLSNYPVHFHMLGELSSGSLLERVVVENGKNHAFVPHASHGVTLKDCVAYKTTADPFWWDPPDVDASNNTNDTDWDRCLVIHVTPSGVGNSRAAGFDIGAGLNNRCVDSVAACVQGNPTASEGNRQRSGFAWQEGSSGESWQFQRNLAHNNVDSGILVWQNARFAENLIEDFTAYRCGFEGINHGSYTNRYQYHGAKLTGCGFRQHAKSAVEGPLNIEDVLSDSPLTVTKHNSGFPYPTFFRRCTFPQVVYIEGIGGAGHGTYNIYEDCSLTPAHFNLTGIASESIIEIKEGGVLTHRWQSGVWS